MEVLYPCCAGLDVHAGSVTACARIASGRQVSYEHHTAPTTTRGLLELARASSSGSATERPAVRRRGAGVRRCCS
jgi:hypothetical protein